MPTTTIRLTDRQVETLAAALMLYVERPDLAEEKKIARVIETNSGKPLTETELEELQNVLDDEIEEFASNR